MQYPSCHHIMAQHHEDKHSFHFSCKTKSCFAAGIHNANIAIQSNNLKRMHQKHQVHYAKTLQKRSFTFLSTFIIAAVQYKQQCY